MSPRSKVKSEYMKRYKDPRWDVYGPCYRELLRYRLSRRLLEQAHYPWFWEDWGEASTSDDSSAATSGQGSRCPTPQEAPASPLPPPPLSPPGPAAPEGQVRPEPDEVQELEALGDEDRDAGAAASPALPVKVIVEKPEQIETGETDKLPNSIAPRQHRSALFARGNRKAVKSPQRSSIKIKENKHPFALYGWGEKQKDTGSKKTHNVCASAPVHEIYESALRAKSRRQMEKRKLVAQRQRAHSVNVEKNLKVESFFSDNPWMTEYMRCYSAKA